MPPNHCAWLSDCNSNQTKEEKNVRVNERRCTLTCWAQKVRWCWMLSFSSVRYLAVGFLSNRWFERVALWLVVPCTTTRWHTPEMSTRIKIGRSTWNWHSWRSKIAYPPLHTRAAVEKIPWSFVPVQMQSPPSDQRMLHVHWYVSTGRQGYKYRRSVERGSRLLAACRCIIPSPASEWQSGSKQCRPPSSKERKDDRQSSILDCWSFVDGSSRCSDRYRR